MNDLRMVYFGMLGDFSRRPLAALLAAGFNVVGVCVPAAEKRPVIRPLARVTAVSQLPLLTPFAAATIVSMAWQQAIPVYEIGDLNASETRARLADLRADVAGVACYDRRIPASVLTIPRHGFLNVHPSLLPDFRGPAPLFWTFREGINQTGVTVHFMDEGLDTGDIALQAPLTLPEGISGAAADGLLADAGGGLLIEALARLQAGTLPRRPQVGNGRAAPTPQPADFHIPTTWPARRAFNFMRGTAEWGRPFTILAGDKVVVAHTAVSYQPEGQLPQPVVRQETISHIQFSPGILTVAADSSLWQTGEQNQDTAAAG